MGQRLCRCRPASDDGSIPLKKGSEIEGEKKRGRITGKRRKGERR